MTYAIALTLALFVSGIGQASSSTENQSNIHSATGPFYVCSEKHPPSAGPCATAPRLIHGPAAEYSRRARKARYEGTTVLWLIVGTDGRTQDIRVAHSIGMGLDENAVKAVRNWRFQPSEYEGKPVPVQINIEVYFRLTE